MLPKWTPELAVRVATRLQAILDAPQSHSPWVVETARRTGGLPVYGDLGGTITLTPQGEVLMYDEESETVTAVTERMWQDVALASLAKWYPDLQDLLPTRPEAALGCPNCSGSGWMMDGRLFCRLCRGLGWIEHPSAELEAAG